MIGCTGTGLMLAAPISLIRSAEVVSPVTSARIAYSLAPFEMMVWPRCDRM
ncbi:hypothetical protein D3C78_1976230 [compost metagenome]